MTGGEVSAALLRAGVEIREEIADRLSQYLESVLDENTRQNLTALKTEQLFLSGMVDAAVSFAVAGQPSGVFVDVGSGTGLPAVPWMLLGGMQSVVLIEAERRKRDFLERTLSRFGLAGAEAVWGRAEELAHGNLRETADVVTAQAVASAPIALELCAGFARVGGVVALPKGPNAALEAKMAVRVAERMGMEVLTPRPYAVPDSGERLLLLYRKVRSTPPGRPASYARLKREFAPHGGGRAERDGRERSE